jgi:hypothetical protein
MYLAQQLAPAYVRVGGTGGNYLVYQLGKESKCTRGTEFAHRNFTTECLNTTWYAVFAIKVTLFVLMRTWARRVHKWL